MTLQTCKEPLEKYVDSSSRPVIYNTAVISNNASTSFHFWLAFARQSDSMG